MIGASRFRLHRLREPYNQLTPPGSHPLSFIVHIAAIGGGGFIPARIARSFLKDSNKRNIPIQAIGLSLYEALPDVSTLV
jgi:hypothetical protein